MQSLIDEIESFLKKYGTKVQSDEDDEMVWTSPDALEIEMFQKRLIQNEKISEIPFPRSSWESGGYTPYSDKEGKIAHDAILQKIRVLKLNK